MVIFIFFFQHAISKVFVYGLLDGFKFGDGVKGWEVMIV